MSRWVARKVQVVLWRLLEAEAQQAGRAVVTATRPTKPARIAGLDPVRCSPNTRAMTHGRRYFACNPSRDTRLLCRL